MVAVWSATEVTLSAADLAATVRSAVERVGDGFTTLKLKVGTDPAGDVARVIAVRQEVGDAIDLRLDANQGWSRDAAVRAMRALEQAGVGGEFGGPAVGGGEVEGRSLITNLPSAQRVSGEIRGWPMIHKKKHRET